MGCFCAYKPNSVRLSLDDHIPGMIVTHHLLRLSVQTYSTALHTGKDLAVSPSVLLQRLFREGIRSLSFATSLLAPLARYRVGRVLPATWLHIAMGVFGLSSLQCCRAIIMHHYYTINLLFRNKWRQVHFCANHYFIIVSKARNRFYDIFSWHRWNKCSGVSIRRYVGLDMHHLPLF